LTPKVERLKAEGKDDLLVPVQLTGKVPDPRANEPMSTALNAQLERHAVAIGAVLATAALSCSAQRDAHAMLDTLLSAGRSGNDIAFRDEIRKAADSGAARAMQAQANALVDEQLAPTSPSPRQASLSKPQIQALQLER
jgi:hypothetical protein